MSIKQAIKNLKQVNEAGQAAGSMEVVKTNVEDAYEYADDLYVDNDRDVDIEIPNFHANYKKSQSLAATGYTKRKDMPVIDDKDVKDLQRRLKLGTIDVNAPYANETDSSNPFPEGLDKRTGDSWINSGLAIFDGDRKDDRVSAKTRRIAISDLYPIQEQVYFDKSIQACAEFGTKGTTAFLTGNSTFIVSSDNKIIDGHHRWLSGNLIDPKMKVECMVIDLPIDQLLPLTLSYSDAVGNKRNA